MFQYLSDEVGNVKDNLKKHADQTFNTSHVAVDLMLPVYYDRDNGITFEDFSLLVDSWKLIQLQQYFVTDTNSFQFQQRFNDLFFERLFDVNPMSAYLFDTSYARIAFMEQLLCVLPQPGQSVMKCVMARNSSFSFSFSTFTSGWGHTTHTTHSNTTTNNNNNNNSYHYILLTQDTKKILTTLVHELDEKGLRPIEYGQFGEVLFWTLERCLGTVTYEKFHSLWVKLFSQLLYFLVHKSVALCLKRSRAQQQQQQQQSGAMSAMSRRKWFGFLNGRTNATLEIAAHRIAQFFTTSRMKRRLSHQFINKHNASMYSANRQSMKNNDEVHAYSEKQCNNNNKSNNSKNKSMYDDIPLDTSLSRFSRDHSYSFSASQSTRCDTNAQSSSFATTNTATTTFAAISTDDTDPFSGTFISAERLKRKGRQHYSNVSPSASVSGSSSSRSNSLKSFFNRSLSSFSRSNDNHNTALRVVSRDNHPSSSSPRCKRVCPDDSAAASPGGSASVASVAVSKDSWGELEIDLSNARNNSSGLINSNNNNNQNNNNNNNNFSSRSNGESSSCGSELKHVFNINSSNNYYIPDSPDDGDVAATVDFFFFSPSKIVLPLSAKGSGKNYGNI